MTGWEDRILAALAERYPGSAAAGGGKDLRLRGDFLFPDFDTAAPDERESFLEAAEVLEASGLVGLLWKGRRGEELRALVLKDPTALYSRLGRRSPAEEAEAARSAARHCASSCAPVDGGSFFAYLERNLGPQDAAAGMDAQAVLDLGKLFEAIASLPRGPDGGPIPGITPRALSVRLFADSKRLERLLGLFRSLLHKAARDGALTSPTAMSAAAPLTAAMSPAPNLSALERSFSETLVAGRLSFSFTVGVVENEPGLVLGLPHQTTLRLDRVRPLAAHGIPRALSVENKESFYALVEGGLHFDCLFYTAGHPNPAVVALVRALSRSGFDLFHAGDLDPDGILILQELRDAAGRGVTPVKMDGATFDRYRAFGRPLDGTMMARVARISDEVMALPGIRGLVERVLATGLSVEQEIIDYGQ